MIPDFVYLSVSVLPFHCSSVRLSALASRKKRESSDKASILHAKPFCSSIIEFEKGNYLKQQQLLKLTSNLFFLKISINLLLQQQRFCLFGRAPLPFHCSSVRLLALASHKKTGEGKQSLMNTS